MPNRYGKPPSGPWGRLKPVNQDALESIGLPSKGDSRLLDFKTQERYYTRIVERYLSFCSDAGQRDELLKRFESLDLSETIQEPSSAAYSISSRPKSSSSTSSWRQRMPAEPAFKSAAKKETIVSEAPTELPDASETNALPDVLMALRKLREGIVATKRVDAFAIQAYLFCIRLSVMAKLPDSYHPAILHLLKQIHPRNALTAVELQDIVGYLVLDTACRRSELSEAFSIRITYGLKDKKVDAALKALMHDNYVLWQKVKHTVDGHKAKLMDFAEGEMRTHALKCFGRTYLSVGLSFLESTMGKRWDELKGDGVGWHLEGDKVVIRKVRA